jgi:hypothetical protein
MATHHKIEFYVPADHADAVVAAVCAAGAGEIGGYDSCCWRTEGVGQFRPLPGSRPFIGAEGALERVAEVKVEMVCAAGRVAAVIAALKAAHPYETPALQHWPVALD